MFIKKLDIFLNILMALSLVYFGGLRNVGPRIFSIRPLYKQVLFKNYQVDFSLSLKLDSKGFYAVIKGKHVTNYNSMTFKFSD